MDASKQELEAASQEDSRSELEALSRDEGAADTGQSQAHPFTSIGGEKSGQSGHMANIVHGLSAGLNRPVAGYISALMDSGPDESFLQAYDKGQRQYDAELSAKTKNVGGLVGAAEGIVSSIPAYALAGPAFPVVAAIQGMSESKSDSPAGILTTGAGHAVGAYAGGKVIDAVLGPVASMIGRKASGFRRSALNTARKSSDIAESKGGDVAGFANEVESAAQRASRKGGFSNDLKNKAMEARASGADKNNPALADKIDEILGIGNYRGGRSSSDMEAELMRGPRDTSVMSDAEMASAMPSPRLQDHGVEYPILSPHPQAGIKASGGGSHTGGTVAGKGQTMSGLEDTVVKNPIIGEISGSDAEPLLSRFESDLSPGHKIAPESGRLPGESMSDYADWKLATSGTVGGDASADVIGLKLDRGSPLSSSVGGFISGAKEGISAMLSNPLSVASPGAALSMAGAKAARGALSGLNSGLSASSKADALASLYRGISSRQSKSPLLGSIQNFVGKSDPRQP